MISASDYRRRMNSLARAEAVRGAAGKPIPNISAVAMARRFSTSARYEGVDPVAASRPDAIPLMLRH